MIYFVQAYSPQKRDQSPIKIGFTSDPDLRKRVIDLQVGNPYPLKALGVIAAGNMELEESLHKKFNAHRLCGEWFSYTQALREFITSYTTGYLWGKVEQKIRLPKWLRQMLTPNKVLGPVFINSAPSVSLPSRWVEIEGKLVRRNKIVNTSI